MAGIAIEGGKDDQGYYIFIKQFEEALGLRRNSAREIVSSESLKTALGKGIQLGKRQKIRVRVKVTQNKRVGLDTSQQLRYNKISLNYCLG